MKFLKKLFLPAVFAWFFMTLLIDIVAVPTVFKNVTKIEEAGKVGMTIFGRFNYFEIFFALIVLNASIIYFKKNQVKKFLFFAVPLFILSLLYTFKFTPAITYYSLASFQPPSTAPNFVEIQTNQAFYHQLYRTLDSIKLIVLLVFGGMILIHETKEQI